MTAQIEATASQLKKRCALDVYKASRALIAASFGQQYFDECITRLTESKAVCELSKKGEIRVLLITSKDIVIGNHPEWLKIIQIDKIPNWPAEDAYQNRFIKWAIPFLFTNIKCSVYVDSDLIITNEPKKLLRIFNIIEKRHFFITRHVIRKGWLDEFNEIINGKRYLNLDKLNRQKNFYQKADLPPNCEVYKNNFIGRIHGSKYDILNLEVLNQLSEYSEKDQLALVYAIFKTKLKPFGLREGKVLFASHVDYVNLKTITFVDYFHRNKFYSICKMIGSKGVGCELYKQKTVAIVVPMYKEILSSDEQISLRHLEHYLGGYDKYIIAPKKLNTIRNHSTFSIYPMDEKYFISKESYSRLLVSKSFYEAFSEYEYILIYQPDCLVFSDQLLEWCKKGNDYIGAPWYKTETMKRANWAPDEDSVGNGGLSLRKVESHLRVLRVYQSPLNIAKRKLIAYLSWFKYCLSRIPQETVDFLTRKQKIPSIFKNAYIKKRIMDFQRNEDRFWSLEAKKYYPDFKVAPLDTAVSFSFEVGPRYCFEKNNQTLPFGCHAWAIYDREFWEPYLLKESVPPK